MEEVKQVPPGDGFPARLKKERLRLAVSIREAATQSEISVSTWERWEAGTQTPQHGPKFRQVASYLRVTPGYLLDGDDE